MNKLIAQYVAMQSRMQEMLKDKKGATMVEYALMVALIAVACALTVKGLGTTTDGVFSNAASKLTATTP